MENSAVGTLILEAGIAGMQYSVDLSSEQGKNLIDSMVPGTQLSLVREKNNRYDNWAIAIFSSDGQIKLGYISRYKNEAVARLMDAGVSVIALVSSIDDMDAAKTKTRTENMLIPIKLYVVNGNNAYEPSNANIDYSLKSRIEDFLIEMEGLDREYASNLKILFRQLLSAFSIELVQADSKIAWQEAELLEIYLGMTLEIHSFSMEHDSETADYIRQIVDAYGQILDDYLSPKADLYKHIQEFSVILQLFGKMLIECDRRVTPKEIETLEYYTNLWNQESEKLKSRCIDFDQFENEIIYEYEQLDFEAGNVNVKMAVKGYVDATLNRANQNHMTQSARYRKVFGTASESLPNNLSLLEFEKMYENTKQEKYRELYDLTKSIADQLLEFIRKS